MANIMMTGSSRAYIGILYSALAFAAFSTADVTRKYMSLDHNVYDILFWQALVGIATFAVLSPWFGGFSSLTNSQHRRWHILRGVLMAGNTTLSLLALSQVPLMDAYTIYFTTPFVVSLLSMMIFGEHVGTVRLLAIGAGFCGALIAFRPGFEVLHPAYLLACAAVFTFGFSNLIAKHVGSGGQVLSFGLYPLFFVVILCLVVRGDQILLVPDFHFLWLALVTGLTYVAALVLISMSFTLADASVVAPFQYTQLIWALVFGYWVFGDVPDFMRLAGAFIIVAAGLLFFAREHLRARACPP